MLYSKKILFDQLTPITLFSSIKRHFKNEITLLFESAINSEEGNFSFLFIGARERIIYKNSTTIHVNEDGVRKSLTSNPFEYLKKRYKTIDTLKYKNYAKENSLLFVDGFIGYVGYDAVKIFEPRLKFNMNGLKDEIDIPDVNFIRPKIICTFSHKSNTLTLHTFMYSYKTKLDEIEIILKKPHNFIKIKKTTIDESKGSLFFSKEKFFKIVTNSKKMIKDGEIFQILISNRFTQYAKIDKLSFYRILRNKNPSPYMFLLDFNDFAIVGSSPEVMVALKDNNIILRPIAGTRKRGDTYEKDKAYEKELLNDEKERAEHIMLVDLGRNDVGKVAEVGSVHVGDMMRVDRYSHVMHMVSDIEAKLDKKSDMFDLFAATFTAGTMTGTPKVRAMELISDFEGLKRSFYSGAVGYFGFDGNMDSAIMIRTAYLDSEKIIFQAGAGIVAQSKHELEYLEVTNKLKAMTSSLNDLKE
ncbi:MAG: anthranilate synthase component I family protein [Sulfurospirillum sp.]|nr:anthranilate synthase component I family protein [Sulfurospirillum sp.]